MKIGWGAVIAGDGIDRWSIHRSLFDHSIGEPSIAALIAINEGCAIDGGSTMSDPWRMYVNKVPLQGVLMMMAQLSGACL
jgi:hypothetical protein